MTDRADRASIFSALYASRQHNQIFAARAPKSKSKSTTSDPGGGGGIKGLNARTGSIRDPKLPSKGFYSPPGRSSRINPIAKFSYVKNNKDSSRHITQHCHYLEFRERGPNEPQRQWHTRDRDNVPREEVIQELLDNRGSKAAMFKIILSPNNNELNHEDMARRVMEQWQEKISLNINYSFVKHSNTAHIHLHFLLHGTTVEGNDYRIEKTDINELRELAFQHQYEIEYELVKDNYHMQQEIQAWREDQQRCHEFLKNLELLKELDLYRPEYDKQVQQDLGINKYYHPEKFWLPPDAEHLAHMAQLQREHPELFPGLSVTTNQHKDPAQNLVNFLYTAISNPDRRVLEERTLEPDRKEQILYKNPIRPTVQRLYDLIDKEHSKDSLMDRRNEAPHELTHPADRIYNHEPSQVPEIDNLERDKENDKDAVSVLMLASQIQDQHNIEAEQREVPPEIFLWELVTAQSELTISADDIDHWQDEYIPDSPAESIEHTIEAPTIEVDTDVTEDDKEPDDDDW